MILSVHGINKSFDGKDILRDASFHVENNEKVAIVGINGAGKTTLLKLILGELSPDDGDVTFAKDVTVGYLAQNQNIDTTNTIYEEFKEVKRAVWELEENIRSAEEQMKHLQDFYLHLELMQHKLCMNHLDLKFHIFDQRHNLYLNSIIHMYHRHHFYLNKDYHNHLN